MPRQREERLARGLSPENDVRIGTARLGQVHICAAAAGCITTIVAVTHTAATTITAIAAAAVAIPNGNAGAWHRLDKGRVAATETRAALRQSGRATPTRRGLSSRSVRAGAGANARHVTGAAGQA
jgi:hypothetical protein